MRLTAGAIEIPEGDPFKNDLLNRKVSADPLTELVRSSSDPLVLCLDAPWGEGKSTFLQMWRCDLRKASIPTVAFSAWEHDFAEDPLIALMGEIEAQLASVEAMQADGPGSVQSKLQTAKKWGLKFVKATVPSAVKIATAGVLDLNEFTEEVLAELGEKFTAAKMAEYEEGRKSISKFRSALAEFAAKLGQREDGSQVPLVVLIDELDRCRPTYAIQLLERLKHLFSVPGTVYVLALDREQLGHAVRSQYGDRIDADGYLRRFFDLEFRLPEPPAGTFCQAQFKRFGLEEFFADRKGNETRYDRNQIAETLAELFAAFNCSLRDQERGFSMLSLSIRTTPTNQLLYPLLLSTLIVLKLKRPETYRHFAAGRCNYTEVLRQIAETKRGREFLDSNYGMALEAHLVACAEDRYHGDDVSVGYVDQASDGSLPETVRKRAQRILEILKDYSFRRSAYGCLPYLVGKVDLVSSFRN